MYSLKTFPYSRLGLLKYCVHDVNVHKNSYGAAFVLETFSSDLKLKSEK